MATSTIKELFSEFSFSGTPDSDNDIITNVPLLTHIPLQVFSASRDGWIYNFNMNNLKNNDYWYVRVQGNSVSGQYSGKIIAKLK